MTRPEDAEFVKRWCIGMLILGISPIVGWLIWLAAQ